MKVNVVVRATQITEYTYEISGVNSIEAAQKCARPAQGGAAHGVRTAAFAVVGGGIRRRRAAYERLVRALEGDERDSVRHHDAAELRAVAAVHVTVHRLVRVPAGRDIYYRA